MIRLRVWLTDDIEDFDKSLSVFKDFCYNNLISFVNIEIKSKENKIFDFSTNTNFNEVEFKFIEEPSLVKAIKLLPDGDIIKKNYLFSSNDIKDITESIIKCKNIRKSLSNK